MVRKVTFTVCQTAVLLLQQATVSPVILVVLESVRGELLDILQHVVVLCRRSLGARCSAESYSISFYTASVC